MLLIDDKDEGKELTKKTTKIVRTMNETVSKFMDYIPTSWP